MTAIGNLVQQTTTSEGTGNLTLVTSSGRQSFNGAFGTGGTDAFYYFVMHRTAAEWEVGTGHLLDATTLVRDTVINSSNADAAVNFSAGTKDVTNAVAASDVAQLVNLASTANGRGASLIGIEDSGALIAATTVEGALAEIASDLATNYQPLDADLTSWAGVTRIAGFDTFVATPSSANLAAFVTGATGSGALVFGTSPGFTTSANPASDDGATLGTTSLKWSDLFLANGAVINFNAGDVTITHSAANTLTFAGATSGYTFADGNVGIGASPGVLFDVQSSSATAVARVKTTFTNANAELYLTSDGSGDSVIRMGNAAGISNGLIYYDANSNFMGFRTAATDRVRIDSSGNVGIGTTNPQRSLHVDSGSVAVAVRVESSNAQGSYLRLFQTGDAETAGLELRGDTNMGYLNCASGQLSFQTGSADRMRIDSSGNVGIGTTTPAVKLHVYDTGTDLRERLQATGANSTSVIEFQNDARVWQFGNRGDLGDAFCVRDITAGAYRLAIDSSGNVGIGTTSPRQTLSVGGNLDIYSGGANSPTQASIRSSGHLVLNASGANTVYFNYDTGTGGVIFANGAAGTVARVDSSGKAFLGGSSSPTEDLDINGDAIRIRTSQTPASAAAAGTAGMICWDSSYIYVCTATNTWKRAAIATW